LRLLLNVKAPINSHATSWAEQNNETECAQLILSYTQSRKVG